MASNKIPVWDVYIEGSVDPVAKGIHKNQANGIVHDFAEQGIEARAVRGKGNKSSKFSKSRKDREL